MVKIVDTPLSDVIGYIFTVISPLFIVLGAFRYIRISNKLKTIDETTNNEKVDL